MWTVRGASCDAIDDCLIVEKEAHFSGWTSCGPNDGKEVDGIEFLELDAVGGLFWGPPGIKPLPIIVRTKADGTRAFGIQIELWGGRPVREEEEKGCMWPDQGVVKALHQAEASSRVIVSSG